MYPLLLPWNLKYYGYGYVTQPANYCTVLSYQHTVLSYLQPLGLNRPMRQVHTSLRPLRGKYPQ